MKRILFVDDEDRVLQALQRMLRGLRREWDMTFVTSSREALDVLDREMFDVLVTDMRMPGLDGVSLLREVRTHHPQVIRIVLSGHSSRSTTIQSVGLAHRYLAKPCDKDALEGAIRRSLDLRAIVHDEALVSLLTQVQSLPSMPVVYTEIREALQRENVTAGRIGDIVAKDLAMTAKVLQLVNSAFFGLPREVSNPAQAVVLLGLDLIQSLVLGVDLFSQFENVDERSFDIEELWDHSMRSSTIAKRISLDAGLDARCADIAFTGALLHDVGKLIFAQGFADRYAAVLQDATDRGVELPVTEREAFGSTHADIGGYLMSLWGLPDSIVEPVAYYHAPSRAAETHFGPVTAVHVANALAQPSQVHSQIHSGGVLDHEHLARLGVSHRLAAWQQMAAELPSKNTSCLASEGVS